MVMFQKSPERDMYEPICFLFDFEVHKSAIYLHVTGKTFATETKPREDSKSPGCDVIGTDVANIGKYREKGSNSF